MSRRDGRGPPSGSSGWPGVMDPGTAPTTASLTGENPTPGADHRASSPTAPREITYLAYTNNQPRVYLYNIDSGRQEVPGRLSGMTFAPRFSPDGNRVIFSWAQSGNTDIYVMDLRTHRQRQRLTSDRGIDTAPSYSPDGSRIVFESDGAAGPSSST